MNVLQMQLKPNEVMKGRINYEQSLQPIGAKDAGGILINAAQQMQVISFDPMVLHQPPVGSVFLTIIQTPGFIDDGYVWKDQEHSERDQLDAQRSVEVIENTSGHIPGENIATIGRRRFKYHMNNASSYLQLLQYFPVGHAADKSVISYKSPAPKMITRKPYESNHTKYSRLPKSFMAKNKLPERKALREVALERYNDNYKLMHNVFYPQHSSGDVVEIEGAFTKMLKGDQTEEEVIDILQNKIQWLQSEIASQQ